MVLLDGEECAAAGVLCCVKKLFLDAEKLIVLADTVGTAGCAGLYLTCVDADGDVCDRGILGLAGAVGHDCGPARTVSHLNGVEGLGQSADLIELLIKNMVCPRCIIAVRDILASEGIKAKTVSLGDVETAEDPSSEQLACASLVAVQASDRYDTQGVSGAGK